MAVGAIGRYDHFIIVSVSEVIEQLGEKEGVNPSIVDLLGPGFQAVQLNV